VQTRSLSAGLTVSAQGLGCMGMSRIYGPADEDDARDALRRALDLGVTLFDTADVYGGGHNEELLGSALGRRRAQIVLSTKFGFRADGDRRIDGRPDYVRAACDASLKRLGSDYIDIYYPHRLDPATPIEATVGAIADRVRQLALTRRCTPAQIALAWVLSRGDDVVPIPGSKRAHHVEANVRAGDIELDAAELAWLDHIFAPGAAAGERYAGALRQQWTTIGE